MHSILAEIQQLSLASTRPPAHEMMRRLPRFLATAAASLAVVALTTAVHGANLQFALRASWAPTSLGIEASEFFTDAHQYFTFITKYNEQLSSSPSPPSDRQQHQTALAIASKILGPSSLAVLSSSLSLRALSPAAETLRSMRANRVARAVQSIPFDRAEAQEIKDAREAEWNACRALIAFEGKLHCGAEGIDWNCRAAAEEEKADASDSASEEHEPVQSFDHIHPASDAHASPAVILYADPASPDFARAHAAIVARLALQPLRYVLRPCVGSSSPSSSNPSSPASPVPMSLQGFGVELAIKNMEYKVLDDSKIAMDGSSEDAANHAELPDDESASNQVAQEIAGFNFEVLKRRRPELVAGLDALRDLLTKEAAADAESDASASTGEKKVAVWELKDLGFQASQRVLQSQSEPLEMLRDLSQNFPMYAQALTRTRINSTLKTAVEANSLGGGHAMHAQAAFASLPAPGTNALEINGVQIDLGANGEDLDYFSVLDLLKAEATCIDDLAAVQLAPQSVARLLQEVKLHSRAEAEAASSASQSAHAAHAESSPFLLHMATSSPATKRILVFLNDIERDARYKPWPASLQEYLAPSWPNQLKYVRKNAYTAVIIADPAHAKGLEFMHQARFFVAQNAPMRMGVVFWIPSIKPAAAASAKAASTAVPAVRPAWNVDVLSKLEGPWADFVGDSDSEAEADAASAALLASSGPVADLASQQAKVAKLFYWLLIQGGSEGAAGGKRTLSSRDHAYEFLAALHESNTRRTGAVTDSEMETVFATISKRVGYTGSKARTAAQVWAMPEFDELVAAAHDYAIERGFTDDDSLPSGPDSVPGQMPLMVVNGVVHRSTAAKSFREVMMGAIMEQQHRIMMAVYTGALNDRMDIHETLQSKPNVLKRINPAITSLVKQMQFITAFPRLDSASLLSFKYLRAPDAEMDGASGVATQSYWLIADWTSPRGLAFVADLLEFVAKASGNGVLLRAALLFNNARSDAGASSGVARVASAIMHASPALTEPQRFELLRQLVMLARYFSVDSAERQMKALELFLTSNAPKLDHARAALASTDAEMHGGRGLNPSIEAGYIATATGLLPGESALVLNGRLISLSQPVFHDAASIVPDLRLLSEFTAANFDLGLLADLLAQPTGRAAPIQFLGEAASKAEDQEWRSEVLMRVSFVLLRRSIASGAAGPSVGRPAAAASGEKLYASLDPNSAAVIKVTNPSSLLSVRAVVDPLSKAAQKLAPVLITLRDQFAPNMLVWLSPKSGLTEFPLKRFYRYALAAGPSGGLAFDEESGSLRPYSGALFRNLRTKHILSTVMFTPESWSIRLRAAKQDLDNLNVAELNAPGASADAVQHVSYELEHLLLFGQCLDLVRMEPPAGLQLMLGSAAVPFMGDTVVMQNLGYFQLKAGPGEWTVSIADQRHAEIYEIQPESKTESGEQAASVSSSAGVRKGTRQLFIRSFNEGFVRLDVLRKPHQESAQLLDPSVLHRRGGSGKKAYKAAADAVGNMWNSVFGGEAGSAATAPAANADGSVAVVDPVMLPRSGETIHVFSLASGHLYERFLKIMMLSVLGSTRHPVKFWFLANFASPQFREFVPLMARQLGFEAEFVTYKWPSWLRRQEEKQRIIWGYKILFLDVLFPLAVPRVIYIDADQVVRGDIAELWQLDLQGAPYAYTPFCDSNTETEGFRFWKSGYWKDHLKGKPYHISALYIVDLEVFRAMRAGDSLRGIYDNLSADPNSLANLDQDLPNYAQHMVPIHSLPLEWLWCQTWCGAETLPRAKTIDLCNNPLTKTPKLEVAKQLLPEWVGLDNRARALGEMFAERAVMQAQAQAHGHHHSHRHTAAASEETVSVPANAEAIRQAQKTVLH